MKKIIGGPILAFFWLILKKILDYFFNESDFHYLTSAILILALTFLYKKKDE